MKHTEEWTKENPFVFKKACGCCYKWDGGMIIDVQCDMHYLAPELLQTLSNIAAIYGAVLPEEDYEKLTELLKKARGQE